ncbi:MAG TPA: ATP-binding protein [Polyangiaceae bacterium]|nr:ATP-binding protein [Polyangiaceae bacterium]
MAAADSDSASQLTFRRLSIHAPRDYRNWVRAAIVAAVVGYTIAFLSIQMDHVWTEQAHPRELYVVAAGLVAAWLERRGRLQAAARLVIAAVWAEIHISLMTQGARAPVGGVFPIVLTVVILCFGIRAGYLVALSSLLSIPGFVLLGPHVGMGPGLHTGDLIFLFSLVGSALAIAVLLGLLMSTLGGVLRNAERDARRVRELIDGAPDAILAVNEQGTIDDCNPSAEALFERRRADLLGMHFRSLGLRQGGAAPAPRDAVDLSELQPEPRELLAFPASRSGDQPVPLEGISRSVTRADGSKDMLVVLRDLTSRKLAEERTQSLQRQLQHAQKLEALGKLAGGVAHDFNNLLMAVGGYGEALSRHEDAPVREIADSLIGLRQRAAGLTGHLLAFARKGMTQPRSMDLSRAVNEMPRLLPQLIGHRIALEIDAPEPAFIYADPAQIEQVLMNLALNARDAMPDGGLLRMSCRLRSDVDRVELCVTDTGHGMDDATRLSAFEPFFTTKPRSQGTGLGLALVQGIMEASGGTIALQSRPGHGTSFTLSWKALSFGIELSSREPGELQRQREN